MKEIKILVKQVGKEAELRTIPNELEALQTLVGGYIECVPVGWGISVLCNEEGRIAGEEYNCCFSGREFVGDICFANSKGSGFASLTAKQIGYIKDDLASRI